MVEVEATGWVEYNQARSWPLNDINVGETLTVSFHVDSDNFVNSSTYPTRG